MRPKNTTNNKIFEGIPFAAYPAKTFRLQNGAVVPGRTVVEHCEIVGNTALALIALYPPALRSALFPTNAAFAAACHDIGKISPSFFEKLRRACAIPPQNWVALPVNYPPKTPLSKLVNSLKGVSSRLMRKEFGDFHPWLKRRGVLWSPSYFAASCGGAPIEILRQYIEQQQAVPA